MLRKQVRLHTGNHWASHSLLTEYSRSTKWSDWAGRCSRVAQYWHFVHSMWDLSAFSHIMNLLMAQGLVQDTRLCLENDVNGIKAGKARILNSLLGSVRQLPLLHPCYSRWTGDLFLAGPSRSCCNTRLMRHLSAVAFQKKMHRYCCSYSGHKKKKKQKRAKPSNYHNHEHNHCQIFEIIGIY